MVIVGTYFKDTLKIKGKASVGKLTKSEISIDTKEKTQKNKKISYSNHIYYKLLLFTSTAKMG